MVTVPCAVEWVATFSGLDAAGQVRALAAGWGACCEEERSLVLSDVRHYFRVNV